MFFPVLSQSAIGRVSSYQAELWLSRQYHVYGPRTCGWPLGSRQPPPHKKKHRPKPWGTHHSPTSADLARPRLSSLLAAAKQNHSRRGCTWVTLGRGATPMGAPVYVRNVTGLIVIWGWVLGTVNGGRIRRSKSSFCSIQIAD